MEATESSSLLNNKKYKNYKVIILSFFLAAILWTFLVLHLIDSSNLSYNLSNYKLSSTYNHSKEGRIILVGDIHGMFKPFDHLLQELEFDEEFDTLISLGDIVNKGPESTPVIQKLSDINALAVRGNHDQKVIEWKAWFDQVESVKGGKEWLELGAPKNLKPKRALSLPKSWEWQGPHFQIAKELNDTTKEYLFNTPVLLHIPQHDLYAVHAGMLSHDPTKPKSAINPNHVNGDIDLWSIPQNTPDNMIEMRSIDPMGKPIKKPKGGVKWYEYWNKDMETCHGDKCIPHRIIYGHAAARGLDLNEYTYGLDTGCCQGRRLTAMVIHPESTIEAAHHHHHKKGGKGKGKKGDKKHKGDGNKGGDDDKKHKGDGNDEGNDKDGGKKKNSPKLKFERDVPISSATTGQIFSVGCI
ncbi:Metallo-dependent phosphatase [Wallemia mellicola]|nr:Metallo-dependent phosphatase [Wallemia mellicola]